MFVDSHCHLHLLELKDSDSVDAVVERARQAHIEHMLCVCTELNEVETLQHFAETYSDVTFSVGVHPNHQPRALVELEGLLSLAQHAKCWAIGETGLDYYRQEDDTQWQRDRFGVHIEAAKQSKKPLIIHTRSAQKDTIDVMRAYQASDAAGVVHCFTENWDMAKKAMDLGFYISFSGIVTFKNAVELQEVAKKMPLDRMLIETDCPYLAPVPHRGKQNEPAFVKHVAEFLAQLRQEPLETFAQQTTHNFYQLFRSVG